MTMQLEANRFTTIAALAKEVGVLLQDQKITVPVLAAAGGLDLICEELDRMLPPEDFVRVMFGDQLKVVELKAD